jgi:hypothetical protein
VIKLGYRGLYKSPTIFRTVKSRRLRWARWGRQDRRAQILSAKTVKRKAFRLTREDTSNAEMEVQK